MHWPPSRPCSWRQPQPWQTRPTRSETGDPVINLAGGFTYTIISTGCTDSVTSTESGGTFPMPEDFDANVVFSAGDETWLISNHELTQPRPGDFQGDVGKCAVPEQTAGDGDSDGSGSVSRIVLAKDGLTVLRRELITTGLHDNCAGAKTPWNTYLTNEEFPFLNDPDKLSGWVWEIDPATGAETRLTGMGRFSHEQEARVGKNWYLTNDRGNYQYLFKFVPDRANDLTTGSLYGLVFDRATSSGHWGRPARPVQRRGGHGRACRAGDRGELVREGRGNAHCRFRRCGRLHRVGRPSQSGQRLEAHRPQPGKRSTDRSSSRAASPGWRVPTTSASRMRN